MPDQSPGFLHRMGLAWRVLIGGPGALLHEDAADRSLGDAGAMSLESRLAGLKMDLEDRDREIVRLKQEFERLRENARAETTEAGATELLRLAGKAAPLLSQLVTLRAMHEAGTELKATDVLKLAAKIEKSFHDIGLEAVGRVGAAASFDARIHQRMSGGDVRDGDPVKVRFIGYRFNESIVTKAMVSREEKSHGDRV